MLRAQPNLYVVRPGGRERDRAGLSLRAAPDGDADGDRPEPPGPARVAPERRARRRGRSRRLRAARVLQGPREPDLILIATGSEVHLCNQAAALLESDGIATRLVSMPCVERFARAGRRLPRPRPAARRCGRASASRRSSPLRLAPLGRRRRRGARHDDLRRAAPREGPLRALRLHARARRRGRPQGRRRLGFAVGGEAMATEVKVNERLAALTAAGTSVWLDQIRRSLIESGELERLDRGVLAARRDVQPDDLQQAILGSTDYDDRLAELARGGRGTREIYQDLVIGDIQHACDVLRAVYDATGPLRRLRLARGRSRPRFRHRANDGAGARVLGARRSPEPDDQDPGHATRESRRSRR